MRGELWSWMGASVAIIGVLRGIVPAEYREVLSSLFMKVFMFLSPYAYFVIPEFEGPNMNQLYASVRTYLSTKTATGALVSHLWQPRNAKSITFSLASGHRILDTFEGVKLEWVHNVSEKKTTTTASVDPTGDEKRSFKLRVHRNDKEKVLAKYFTYVETQAVEIQRSNRELQLFTNNSKGRGKAWDAAPFLHPSSFDSLALDPELRKEIVDDLEEFVESENFYRRVGKAWKRGYLLYGPPGTGKSSMIAAIANKLHYDVYDLELTEVESNAELRRLLLQTSNKSIIVIEDIDCSLELSGQRSQSQRPSRTGGRGREDGFGGRGREEGFGGRGRENLEGRGGDSFQFGPPPANIDQQVKDKTSRVTLSGLLNFTDGLWSACGSERVFVFTTNFVDKLDPALLRPGRMDMHIRLGYCTFAAFKVLAMNYMEMKNHRLFPDIEMEMEDCPITPAEVAEILTQHKREDDLAMEKLLEVVRIRKSEAPLEEGTDTETQDSQEQRMNKKLGINTSRSTDEIMKPKTLESLGSFKGRGRGRRSSDSSLIDS